MHFFLCLGLVVSFVDVTFAARKPQRMKPPDEHSTDLLDALRRDRDRWAQLAMEQAEYIRQLEEQITYYQTQLEMKKQEPQQKPNITIENHGKLTFIAEQNNDVHDNHGCNIYLTPQEEEEEPVKEDSPSAEQILGIPHEGKYTEVRQYIEERCRFDEEFKTFVANHTRVTLCQRLSKEFGWTVDHYALGRNINRKRKR